MMPYPQLHISDFRIDYCHMQNRTKARNDQQTGTCNLIQTLSITP